MAVFKGYRDQILKGSAGQDIGKNKNGDNPMGGFGSQLGKLVMAIDNKRKKDAAGAPALGRGTGEDPESGMDYRDPGMSSMQEESPIESPDADLAQFDPRSILEKELNGRDEMRRNNRARAVFGGPRSESYFK